MSAPTILFFPPVSPMKPKPMQIVDLSVGRKWSNKNMSVFNKKRTHWCGKGTGNRPKVINTRDFFCKLKKQGIHGSISLISHLPQRKVFLSDSSHAWQSTVSPYTKAKRVAKKSSKSPRNLAWEQQTHFRSSLLSLRKIAGYTESRSPHPRRPRVSQSGREKMRDESLQAWAEKPSGTDSHRTISKRSSECWLLIGHKKCFVLLCPIDEQHLLNSFREFVHDGYYLATFARFVHQAFLIRNEGTIYTDESKNVWMLPAAAIQFAVRKFCFWRITMYRK